MIRAATSRKMTATARVFGSRSGGVEVAIAVVSLSEVLEHLRCIGVVFGALHQGPRDEAGKGNRLPLAAELKVIGQSVQRRMGLPARHDVELSLDEAMLSPPPLLNLGICHVGLSTLPAAAAQAVHRGASLGRIPSPGRRSLSVGFSLDSRIRDGTVLLLSERDRSYTNSAPKSANLPGDRP